MEITGKVHCFFEQSGTFKREFIKMGIPAEDYDIQNNFGETDNVVDLFGEITTAFEGGGSIFDHIGKDDLILAFFPCIAFCGVSQIWFSAGCKDYRGWEPRRMFEYMLAKGEERHKMFSLLYKFVCIVMTRGLRMVFENPWAMNTFLKTSVFIKRPDVIDEDRSARGDFRTKPTAYWFWNCEPTHGFTNEQTPADKVLNHNQTQDGTKRGVCSTMRSMIAPAYARNFIADFILGKPCNPKVAQQLDLFGP